MSIRKADLRPGTREGEVVMARSLGWMSTELRAHRHFGAMDLA